MLCPSRVRTTITDRDGEGIISPIGTAKRREEVLNKSDRISATEPGKALDSKVAREIPIRAIDNRDDLENGAAHLQGTPPRRLERHIPRPPSPAPTAATQSWAEELQATHRRRSTHLGTITPTSHRAAISPQARAQAADAIGEPPCVSSGRYGKLCRPGD